MVVRPQFGLLSGAASVRPCRVASNPTRRVSNSTRLDRISMGMKLMDRPRQGNRLGVRYPGPLLGRVIGLNMLSASSGDECIPNPLPNVRFAPRRQGGGSWPGSPCPARSFAPRRQGGGLGLWGMRQSEQPGSEDDGTTEGDRGRFGQVDGELRLLGVCPKGSIQAVPFPLRRRGRLHTVGQFPAGRT